MEIQLTYTSISTDKYVKKGVPRFLQMCLIGLNLASLAYQVIELGDMYWLHITHYQLERHI